MPLVLRKATRTATLWSMSEHDCLPAWLRARLRRKADRFARLRHGLERAASLVDIDVLRGDAAWR